MISDFLAMIFEHCKLALYNMEQRILVREIHQLQGISFVPALYTGSEMIWTKLIIEWLGARGTQVTFSGEIFFPSKVPEFLHVLFN